MRQSSLYLFFFLIIPILLTAQESVIFSGRIIDESSGRGIAGIMVRLIGQGQDVTDDQGLFRITVRPNTEQVQIELPAGWAVQYPRNGQAPVPRSATAHLDIEVKQLRAQNDQLLKELSRLQKEQKLKEAQIDSLRQVLEDSLDVYQKRFLVQSYEYEDAARRTEAENQALQQKLAELSARLEAQFMEKNKTEVRGLVSSELLAYLDALKDLRDFLPNFRDVFLHPQAADNFGQIVQRYNAARTPVYTQYQDRLAKVALYWQDPVLTDDLEELYNLIVNDIHPKLILPMNDELIAYQKEVATGRMTRVVATRKAKTRAQESHKALDGPVRTLEQKLQEVTPRLAR